MNIKKILSVIIGTLLIANTCSITYAEMPTNESKNPQTQELFKDYLDAEINDITVKSVMMDKSLLDTRENQYNPQSSASWLSESLSGIKVEGIDTSAFNIVETSENLNILNAKYDMAKKDMENNNYYTNFLAKSSSSENKSTTAEKIFENVYSDIYKDAKETTETPKLEDVINKYGGAATDINTSVVKNINSSNNTLLGELKNSNINNSYNDKKDKNITDFSKASESIDTMLSDFKTDIENNYGNFIKSDAYKKVYDNISTANVTDKIATRQVLPTTISSAVLMANISSLDTQVPISKETVKAQAEANKAATSTSYDTGKNSIDNNAAINYAAACNAAKISSGYNEVYAEWANKAGYNLEDKELTSTTLNFNSEDDLKKFLSDANIEESGMYYLDDTDANSGYQIEISGNSIVLNEIEASSMSDAIKKAQENGATISYDTEIYTNKTRNNIGETKTPSIYDKLDSGDINTLKNTLDQITSAIKQ